MQNLLISACLLGLPCRYNGQVLERHSWIPEQLRERYHLIPVCPEIYGGLPTPRDPAERFGDRVVTKKGVDVTSQYVKGAYAALRLAQQFDCKTAVLKDRSPSCGVRQIYDGTFSGTLKGGMGITTELLLKNGIFVYDETQVSLLLDGKL